MNLSIVVPAYNEQDNIGELVDEIGSAMDSLECDSYELIIVDDGSRDDTWKVISRLSESRSWVKGVRLSRNFGQTAALATGFDAAGGDVIITMDADLQNNPKDIPLLLEKLDQGYDVASGWRTPRMDSFLTKKLPSFIANRMVSYLTGVKLHDFGCTLKAYRAEPLKEIKLYGEMHRLIPLLLSWAGASIAEVKVSHRPRTRGKSNYTMMRTFSVVLDMISLLFFRSYSTRPIHIIGLWGFISILFGFVSMLVVVLMKFYRDMDMTGNPFLIISVLLTIVGVQLIGLGLLGELSVRTYYESLGRPTYLIKERSGNWN